MQSGVAGGGADAVSVKPCPGRMHDWGDALAAPGAVCVRCGHVYGRKAAPVQEPSPPAPIQPAAPTVDAADASDGGGLKINETLRARWAAQTPAAGPPADVSGTAAAVPGDPASEVDGEQLAEMLKPYVADGLIGLERWIIDWRGYVPKNPDPEQREELHECTGVLLAKLLPKVAVGPWAKFGFSMTVLYASMRVGAEKKPPAVAPSLDGASATTPPVTRLQSIPPSSQPSGKAEPSDGGTAETVE